MAAEVRDSSSDATSIVYPYTPKPSLQNLIHKNSGVESQPVKPCEASGATFYSASTVSGATLRTLTNQIAEQK